MLDITTGNHATATTLCLEGELSGPAVWELERCWRLREQQAQHSLRLDLRKVVAIDALGKDLLHRMFSAGVQFVVRCRSNKAGALAKPPAR